MSQQQISLNPDLKKLRDEGYEVEIVSGYLVMSNVPYLDSTGMVRRGKLISELTMAADKTTRPSTHVVHFDGDIPHDKTGAPLNKILNHSGSHIVTNGLTAQHKFSSKPRTGYQDYYHKMTTYCEIVSGPAVSLFPDVTAKTFLVVETSDESSVFKYLDTASSRAAITAITEKLRLDRIAIVGLGGTGAYVLDFVAKTPVKEIHLFDGDKFLQHNAFRCPGAASAGELGKKQKKVKYLKNKYSKMHSGLIAHDHYIDAENLHELEEMDFVFLCLDRGEIKRLLADKFEEQGIPFVDTGMGLYEVDGSLGGLIRTTTSTNHMRKHVVEKQRIPFGPDNGNNEYDQNIQIAELNAFNAALAVMKWKKIYNFYQDIEEEHFSTFAIDGNTMINEDKP